MHQGDLLVEDNQTEEEIVIQRSEFHGRTSFALIKRL